MKILIVILLFGAALVSPFHIDSEYRFTAGTLVILLTGVVAFRREVWTRLGLRLTRIQFIHACLWFVFSFVLVREQFRHFESLGIVKLAKSQFTPIQMLFQVSQVLNEEVVLRCLLLAGLFKIGLSRLHASLAQALATATLHACLYWDIDHMALGVSPLLTILFFNIAANVAFVVLGHNLLALGVHVSWNLYRFGAEWTCNYPGRTEAESFLVLEGSPRVILAVFILALSGLYILIRRQPPSGKLSLYD